MSVFCAVLRGQSALLHFPSHRALHTTLLRFLPKTVPYLLTDIGEGIVEVVVKEWFVKEGDKIVQFDPVCEVQSDKASVTITSRFDGQVGKLHHNVDDMAKVGAPLLDIIIADDPSSGGPQRLEDAPSVKNSLQSTQSTEDLSENQYLTNKALATPAVRRIAIENKVDLKQVLATGKGGRILKEDILQHLENITVVKKSETPPSPNLGRNLEDWTEPLTGVKKAMAKTMTEAWKVPHFTYADEVDVTSFGSLKPELQRLKKSSGVKITFLPFILKATSEALKKFPKLNAEADELCENLTVHVSHNLGVAMDTPTGLLVPNIKNVQNLSILEIARELSRLQALGKEGRLGVQDLSKGTLTISNIGAIGGTIATPIILPPQIVIGAVGKMQKVPRFNDEGNVVASDILAISWSADHRLVDGATIARFSNLIKIYLTTPKLLLLL